MAKRNINFKEMRQKVIHPFDNVQNIPINPLNKLSFRAIKKSDQTGNHTDRLRTSPCELPYRVKLPKRVLQSGFSNQSSREECNKFSILLESKGYSNSVSTRKDHQSLRKVASQLSFQGVKNGLKPKCETTRHKQEPQTDKVAQKCRQIKQKQYFSSRKNLHELNSLSKLKGKLISPLKKKSVSQPENPISFKPSRMLVFEHQSILSEHDMVNISELDESTTFDMTPCL